MINNPKDIVAEVLYGSDSFFSVSTYLATLLLDIFKDYLAVFLVIILGLTVWKKVQGENWIPVLTTGTASLLSMIAAVYLTTDTKEVDLGKNGKHEEYLLVKSSVDLIKLGEVIANDTWKTFMFGNPTKTTDSNGEITKYWNTSNNGFFRQRLVDNVLKDYKQNEVDTKKKISDVENSKKLGNQIYTNVDKILLRTGQSYWQLLNAEQIVDVKRKQVNGFKDLDNNEAVLKEQVKILIDEKILTEGEMKGNVVTYYYPYFLKEYAQISTLGDAYLNFTKQDVTSTDPELESLLAKTVISLFGYSFDNKEEKFLSASMIDDKKKDLYNSNTDKNKNAIEVSQSEFKNILSESELGEVNTIMKNNKGNLLIKTVYDDIKKLYPKESDKLKLASAFSQLDEIIGFFNELSNNVSLVNNNCKYTYINTENNKRLDSFNRTKCVGSVNDLISFAERKVFKEHLLINKQKDINDLSMVEKIFLKSPVFYSLKGLGLIFNNKMVNTEVMLSQPVTTTLYKNTLEQKAAVVSNQELNLLNKQNGGLLMDTYSTVTNSIETHISHLNLYKDKLIGIVDIDITEKQESFKEINRIFNKEVLLQSFENELKQNGELVQWYQIGYMWGYLKDSMDTSILYTLTDLDSKSTIENKLAEVQKVHNTYGNDAIMTQVKDTTQVISFLNAVSNMVSGITKEVGSTTTTTPIKILSSLGIAASEAIKSFAYVQAANLIMIGILYVVPALIWMIAVFTWIYKVAIIIAVLPLTTFMLSFVNFQQTKTAIMVLVSLMLTPVILVCMFFISIELASMLPLFINKMLPMFDSLEILLDSSKSAGIIDNIGRTAMVSIDSFSKEGIMGYTINVMVMAKTLIQLFLTTAILLSAFLQTNEYLQMIIGQGSVGLSEGQGALNKTLSTFRMA
jgi:hypothetical protein